MAVLLSLVAALAYGLSDFVGGLASRRTSAWPVAFVGAVAAFVGAVVLALVVEGSPTRSDFLWGALAGVGSGAGGAFLYRGLAAGRMGVVAPISAVGAALLPVCVGVATGERPEVMVWLGIAAAVPGIWLVSREPGGSGDFAAGIVDGVLAGLGFGLLFSTMGQVPDSAGFAPLAVAQGVAVVGVALTAAVLRGRWIPYDVSQAWGIAAGVLATAAVVAFLLATQTGLLTIASVVTSLYPAITIALAAVVLRERIHASQGVGLLLCGVAVSLVAAA
ncbi:drug/metabolite transporter (DMT)-like permease [Nocardioides sp. BE266]|uniref:DMT family transporter n=1 Tax=Nocardioides sp. BE266 TaxID=2817725 RepID=UPI002862D34C|nr:DMT family transporter [Nocardioides sp. BE266]MDR7254528.1 drug/metabolite transporter (DMT)-like permease [Nocardioides sp. BE266]